MDPKILSLDDIQTELRELALDIRAKGLEIELGTLKAGGLSDLHLRDLERAFGCALPDGFKRVVREYDFSGLQIGDTSFGTVRGYFDELLWLNCETTWWCGSPWIFPEAPRTSPRPEQLLMIATGDPYSWLLDASMGGYWALMRRSCTRTRSLLPETSNNSCNAEQAYGSPVCIRAPLKS